MLSRWENPARAIPPRIPPRNPPQTDPNQAEPYKGSEPLLARRPYATRGGMAHEEQNDPVVLATASSAQSSMYQRRPPNLATSTADLSERDIKENPVVKEEETNDTEVFEDHSIQYPIQFNTSS